MITCPCCNHEFDLEKTAPSRGGLTRKQRDVLNFIRGYIATNSGLSPSYDDILSEVGLGSKSGVHRVIHGLIERGFIEIIPGKARSITLLDRAPFRASTASASSDADAFSSRTPITEREHV
jgi:SOS-response transcriptional repressor LexA